MYKQKVLAKKGANSGLFKVCRAANQPMKGKDTIPSPEKSLPPSASPSFLKIFQLGPLGIASFPFIGWLAA